MYQGSNPSALRSREWLRQALLALLKEKSYAQITVKDLCARADLSRQTFYQIFTGKEEVIAYHFSILFGEFAAGLRPDGRAAGGDIFDRFFSFFHVHRDFIDILVANNLTYLLQEQFEQYLQKIDLFWAAASGAEHADYLTAYVAGALTQLLLHWAADGYALPVESVSELARQAFSGQHFTPDERQRAGSEQN